MWTKGTYRQRRQMGGKKHGSCAAQICSATIPCQVRIQRPARFPHGFAFLCEVRRLIPFFGFPVGLSDQRHSLLLPEHGYNSQDDAICVLFSLECGVPRHFLHDHKTGVCSPRKHFSLTENWDSTQFLIGRRRAGVILSTSYPQVAALTLVKGQGFSLHFA